MNAGKQARARCLVPVLCRVLIPFLRPIWGFVLGGSGNQGAPGDGHRCEADTARQLQSGMMRCALVRFSL